MGREGAARPQHRGRLSMPLRDALTRCPDSAQEALGQGLLLAAVIGAVAYPLAFFVWHIGAFG